MTFMFEFFKYFSPRFSQSVLADITIFHFLKVVRHEFLNQFGTCHLIVTM